VRIGMGECQKAWGGYADFNQSRMTAVFPNGGTTYFRSLDKADNVRGYTADGAIADEAGFIKADVWTSVLRPMLIDTGGAFWAKGTPNGRNWFWREWVAAGDMPDAMRWQIPTKGVKIVDGRLESAPHPLENPNINFDEIRQLYETLPERIFRQEILAEFIEDGGGVFRRVLEAAVLEPLDSPLPDRTYVAGVDVADAMDFTVISILDAKTREQVYLDRFNRVGYEALEDRLHAAYNRFRLSSMIIEDNSIGQPVIDHLRGRGMHIIPFHTSSATKQPLIQSLQSALEHGTIKVINNPIQVGELQAYEGKRTAAGYSYSAPSGMHDDTVIALALSLLGVSKSPPAGETIDIDPAVYKPEKRKRVWD
jgi:hypothetical protein